MKNFIAVDLPRLVVENYVECTVAAQIICFKGLVTGGIVISIQISQQDGMVALS
jgi:hypothetical protein